MIFDRERELPLVMTAEPPGAKVADLIAWRAAQQRTNKTGRSLNNVY